MGANIDNVDYQQMIKVANAIATEAASLNTTVNNAFTDMKNMRKDWYGHSYDEFAASANAYIAQLNTCFKFIVTQGPAELAAKAVSYSKGNLHVVNKTGQQSPKNITSITLTNKGTKLRFKSSNIREDESSIKSKFANAESKCDTIKTKLNSIEWESVAGSTTKKELVQKVDTVKNILGTIKSSLSNIINTQQSTIDALEGAAEAVEAGKEITLDIIDAAKNTASSLVSDIQEAASSTWQSLTGKD
mgnify:CR=1 FL=1